MKKNNLKKEVALFLIILSLIFPVYHSYIKINNQAYAKTISIRVKRTKTKVNLSTLNNDIKKQINKYRKEKNIHSFKMKSDLSAMAKVRAKEIYKKFAHKRPNKKTLVDLAYKNKAKEYSVFGEVLLKMKYDKYVNISKIVVDSWKKSVSHDRVISARKYDYVGVGYYIKNGIIYVCAITAYI